MTDEQFHEAMAERREALDLGPNDHVIGCPLAEHHLLHRYSMMMIAMRLRQRLRKNANAPISLGQQLRNVFLLLLSYVYLQAPTHKPIVLSTDNQPLKDGDRILMVLST